MSTFLKVYRSYLIPGERQQIRSEDKGVAALVVSVDWRRRDSTEMRNIARGQEGTGTAWLLMRMS